MLRNLLKIPGLWQDRTYNEHHTTVQGAINTYDFLAPTWFVSNIDDTIGEGTIHHLYDLEMLKAKAWILKEKREELVKYLDVPGVAIGDIFYIQNLVAAIESMSQSSTLIGDIDNSGNVNVLDLGLLINRFGGNDISADLDNSGIVNVIDLSILLSNFGRSL